MWETDLSGLAYFFYALYSLAAIAHVAAVTIAGYIIGAKAKQGPRGARVGLTVGVMSLSVYLILTPDLWYGLPTWMQLGLVSLNAVIVTGLILRRGSTT